MYHIGCDVHDKASHLQHMDGDGALGLYRVVPTTEEGFTKFLDLLDDEPITMTIEASCSYWWLSQFLSAHPKVSQVEIIDPRRSRKIAEELSVQSGYGRASNDRIDAEMSAELSRRKLAPVIHTPTAEQLEIRTLNRFRFDSVNTKSSITRYCISLLKMHGIYISGCQLLKSRTSQQTEIESAPDYVKFIIEQMLARVSLIEKQIPTIENKLDSILPSTNRLIKLLLTVPGIGIVIARIIISELFDIKYFKAPKYVMSYSGLSIVDLSSAGKKKGTIKLNPYCNRYLKYAFVQAAHCARNHKRYRRKYEQDVKLRGTMRAKINLARRIVKAVYWMLTHQQPFRY